MPGWSAAEAIFGISAALNPKDGFLIISNKFLIQDEYTLALSHSLSFSI